MGSGVGSRLPRSGCITTSLRSHLPTSSHVSRGAFSLVVEPSKRARLKPPDWLRVKKQLPAEVCERMRRDGGSVFPAHANTGDPDGPVEACPLMRSQAR